MANSASAGLFILRVVVGLIFAGHGLQKLFGWFGGVGFARLTQSLLRQGFMPPQPWTSLVILGELGGGVSLALGLLTPLGAAGIVGAMVMAIVTSHWKNGFWNSKRGIEFPLALLASAVAIGLAGPGGVALDTQPPLAGILWPATAAPLVFIVLAIIAILVDIVGLLRARRMVATSTSTPVSAPASQPTRPA